MMQWGIVKGNDPYLFGQRLKYYLIRGAKRRRTDVTYPNPSWGYGEVCVFESLRLLEADLSSIITRRSESVKDIPLTIDNAKITVSETSQVGNLESIEWRGNEFIPPIIPGLDNKKDIPKFYY